MREQRFEPNALSQPYAPSRCWHGVASFDKKLTGTKFTVGRFCERSGSLYQVSKPNGISICKMYLCDLHKKSMEKKGYTVTKVT